MEQREPLHTAGGMKIGTATVENHTKVPLKAKNRTTTLSSNFTPGYISKKTNKPKC